MKPDDLAYLKQRAETAGYNTADLIKSINYESGGDPTRWGGKGGNYLGLIQFGPSERKQFGVDVEHPNARNQIDAMFKYLGARGFKPGMGLPDLYSTILAGSPGHYNRADQNGSVMQHVAKMSGATPSTVAIPKQVNALSAGMPMDITPGAIPPALLNSQPQSTPNAPMSGGDTAAVDEVQKYASGLLAPKPQATQAEEPMSDFQMQAQQFHQEQVAKALRGLLG